MRATLDGWRERSDGWLAHPEYEGWLRSQDGRWWDEANVLEGRVEMTPLGPRRCPGWFVGPDGQWIPEMADGSATDVLTERLHLDFGGRR